MKKFLILMLIPVLFFSCEKDSIFMSDQELMIETRKPKEKIDICHYDSDNDSWHTINVSKNALKAHLKHGDIVPDFDKDGYTKETPCNLGSQDDCDDQNALIYPGATEICGDDGIDEDCNGYSDCDDEVCIANELCISCNPELELCEFIDRYDFNPSDPGDSYYVEDVEMDHPFCGSLIRFHVRLSDFELNHHSGNVEAIGFYCQERNQYTGVVQFGYINNETGEYFSDSYRNETQYGFNLARDAFEYLVWLAEQSGF